MTEIILLDGGMGQELVARSARPPSPQWSAGVMREEPEIVEAVHREYAEAGATVLTLNSYCATPERIARDARPEDVDAEFEFLQRTAIDLATKVRADATSNVAIAGCLPPLFDSYHPENTPDFETCLATYERIAAVQGPACDVMLSETMSCVREAKASARAMKTTGKPLWVALSVDDGDGTRLRSGEPVAEGIAAAMEEDADAVLVNCSRPEACTEAMPELAKSGLPFGAYANGFTHAAELRPGGTVAGMEVRTDLDPDAYGDHAMRWVEMGATIVGGCCEVGPAHIARLRERLEEAGHTVVAP